MIVIHAMNVHDALHQGAIKFLEMGVKRDSRNGRVMQMPMPVATVYERPEQRVIFWPERDANPFFHFYESLWMLAGRHDVAPLTKYVKRMSEFSDDGETFNAAYGHRWRNYRISGNGIGIEQLMSITGALRANKDCRRQVLQIWDPWLDLGKNTKDAACNLTATFQVSPPPVERVDMTVFCRSNDAIWGAWGANAVHFSMLHEYVASAVNGRPGRPGRYTQISVNLHVYEPFWGLLEEIASKDWNNPYWRIDEVANGGQYPIMSVVGPEQWDKEVKKFVTDDGRSPPSFLTFDEPFFNEVAMPIVLAHDAFKDGVGEKKYSIPLLILKQCKAADWRLACEQWIERRYRKWKYAADDGVRYG
jgi:thymidylate synthase